MNSRFRLLGLLNLSVFFTLLFVFHLYSAHATSINIDLGDDYSMGTPSPFFGGASGKAGVWNNVETENTVNLLDIAGAPTSVSAHTIAWVYGGTHSLSAASEAERLLYDNIYTAIGQPDWSVVLEGLPDGPYEIYLYAPSNPAVSTGLMSVSGTSVGELQGSTTGDLVEGESYVKVLSTVSGGTLHITGTLSGSLSSYAGLAGIQISDFIDPACQVDLDKDKDVDGKDLAAFALHGAQIQLADLAQDFGSVFHAPAISNLQITRNSIPRPGPGEQVLIAFSFDFEDQDGDLLELKKIVARPALPGTTYLETFTPSTKTGKYAEEILVDDSYGVGIYDLYFELKDSRCLTSGIYSIPFAVTETGVRLLEITGIVPSSGNPGDVVVVQGKGFVEDPLSQNEVHFGGVARGEVLSATATELQVVVPEGALSGPISLATPLGRTQSTESFTVPCSLSISPEIGRLVVGQSVTFTYTASGSVPSGIAWTVNGTTTPDPDLGTLVSDTGNCVYTAPPSVPAANPVTIRCAFQDDSNVYAEVTIEIIAPAPPPGEAVVTATAGGSIETAKGEVAVVVPPGAVGTDTEIKVEAADPDDYPSSTVDALNLAAVQFSSEAVQFSEPITVTFALKSWQEPGTFLPLFWYDEGEDLLVESGMTAQVDGTGMRATAAIDELPETTTSGLSTADGPLGAKVLVAAKPLSVSKVLLGDHLETLQPLFSQFIIGTYPEVPMVEGLTVPFRVRRLTGAGSGPGPFMEGVSVNAYTEDGTKVKLKGVHWSPDGWELIGFMEVPVLPDCGAGETTDATLEITYDTGSGTPTVMSLNFEIDCLCELEFSGDTTPGQAVCGLPVEEWVGKRLVTIQQEQSYRYSRVNVGAGGILRVYAPALPGRLFSDPAVLEVTGDVTIAGEIQTQAYTNFYLQSGKDGEGNNDGGNYGTAGGCNAGVGGYGAPYVIWVNEPACTSYGGIQYCCNTPPCPLISNGRGQDGYPAITGAAGGAGGAKWEKGTWWGFVFNLAGTVYDLATGDYLGAIQGTYGTGTELVRIYNNDENRLKSAGKGGESPPYHTFQDLELASFKPPQGGGGGGGSGKQYVECSLLGIDFCGDHAGGGGGGGGGGAPGLKLVVNGTVTIEAGARIYGAGGDGGQGGDGADQDAAPGGGGGGGNGAQILIVADQVRNNGAIEAPKGVGGLSGEMRYDGKIHLIRSGFGGNGNQGILRVDGDYTGNDPSRIHYYKGPVIGPVMGMDITTQSTWCREVFLGDFPGPSQIGYYYYSVVVNGVEGPIESYENVGGGPYVTVCAELQPGLNAVSIKVNRERFPIYIENKGPYMQLEPWERQYVFYLPGIGDSDGDGLLDGLEQHLGTLPADPDSDHDGLKDAAEVYGATEPLDPDTDDDGALDGTEAALGSDPMNPNSTPEGPGAGSATCDGIDNDLDGLVDEGFPDTDYDGQANCVDPDDDNDGLSDDQEAQLGTNALLTDTDGDGFSDGLEVTVGTNPLDGQSYPGSIAFNLPEPEAEALFGFAVANAGDIDGRGQDDWLISAPQKFVNDGSGFGFGEVYLFAGEDGSLIRRFSLLRNYVDVTQFGYSLAAINDVSGDGVPDVLIGEPFESFEDTPEGGAVHLFSGADGALIRTFVSPLQQRYGHFGMSVAATGGEFWQYHASRIGGLRIIIGEPDNIHGYAWVFSPDGSLMEQIDCPDPGEGEDEEFGRAVSVEGSFEDQGESGTFCLARYRVGAPGQYDEQGRSYLFTRLGQTMYTETDPPFALPDWSRFGSALTHVDSWTPYARETFFAAGAPGYYSIHDGERGLALMLAHSFSGSVITVDPYLLPQHGARFGASLAIVPWIPYSSSFAHYSEAMLAVGAPGQDADEGMVFLFRDSSPLSSSGWTDVVSVGYLVSPSPQGGAQFGHSMALSGAYWPQAMLAVSAPWEDVNGLADQGRVYLFDLTQYDVSDTDTDGLHDAWEQFFGTDSDDSDTEDDGALDGADNCRLISNPDQADADLDGIGDLCDPVQGDTEPPTVPQIFHVEEGETSPVHLDVC